jgi:DNA-directed RNA polymerase subunit RPC12/RpoP
MADPVESVTVDSSKKLVSIRSASRRTKVYAIRRVAWRPGHFQDEQVGANGPWRPVGSLAAEELGSMDVDQALRQLKGGAESPVAVWLTVLDTLTRAQRVPRSVLNNAIKRVLFGFNGLQGPRSPTQWWLPTAFVSREFVQVFVPPPDPIGRLHRLTLSALFGIASRRLWLCSSCLQPFVRHERRPRQMRCDECRKRRVTAANLPQSVLAAYTAVRKRLALRVHRGTLTLEQREQKQQTALHDARLVSQGKLTLAEWKYRHDQKERVGRKAFSTKHVFGGPLTTRREGRRDGHLSAHG